MNQLRHSSVPATALDIAQGVKDGLLFMPLYLPIAIAYAMAGQSSGLTDWEIVIWAALAYAGSAQLACLSALTTGAGLIELLVITFMANARHGFVALSLVPYMQRISKRSLPLLAFTLATPSVGLLPARAKRTNNLQAYALSLQLCQWCQWVLFTIVGVSLGPLVPPAWGPVIAFAAPAAFLGLLASMLKDNVRRGLLVTLIAAVLAVGLAVFWPPQLCAIVAALGAALVALAVPERGTHGKS